MPKPKKLNLPWKTSPNKNPKQVVRKNQSPQNCKRKHTKTTTLRVNQNNKALRQLSKDSMQGAELLPISTNSLKDSKEPISIKANNNSKQITASNSTNRKKLKEIKPIGSENLEPKAHSSRSLANSLKLKQKPRNKTKKTGT